MSRSFFAPEGGGQSAQDTRLNLGPSSSTTTEYRRYSPPPTSSSGAAATSEDKQPFLPNGGHSDQGSIGRAASIGGVGGLGSASAGGASDSLAGMKALPPILSYCSASIMMTVINKYVLSGKKFSMNLVVLLIQSVVGVICVIIASQLGLIQLRPLNYRDARNWAPISTLLVLTIWTGSKALQYLNIPVYTIFKNLTIILIAYGEVIWFGGRVTLFTFCSFMLMVLSSMIAAWSDVSHALAIAQLSVPHTPDSILHGQTIDPDTNKPVAAYDALSAEKNRLNDLQAGGMGDVAGSDGDVMDGMRGWGMLNSGYMWMALNCIVSAAYVLAMRKRIKLTGFKDWDTMYFNNLLSVPVLIIMSFIVEDWSVENWNTNFPPETRSSLLSAIVFSGACAVFIGYTTAWCVRTTSSTTYSMVGALNKLPLAVSGMVFFHDPPVTLGSVSAIFTGFVAGIVYALAKNAQSKAQKKAEAANGLGKGEGGSGAGALGGGGVGLGHGGGGSNKGSRQEMSGEIPMHRMDSRERDRRKD